MIRKVKCLWSTSAFRLSVGRNKNNKKNKKKKKTSDLTLTRLVIIKYYRQYAVDS